MAKKNATKNDIELVKARGRQQLLLKIADGVVSIIKTLVRSAMTVAVAYLAYGGLNVIAGKTTIFDLKAVIEGLKDDPKDRWVWLAVAVVASVAYVRERKLRLRTAKQLSQRVKVLELVIDERRSSSLLSETGQPTRKDRRND